MKGKASYALVSFFVLTCVLSLTSVIRSASAEPKVWTVDDDGPADFHTIDEAIGVADHGDTIYVHNGTYWTANLGGIEVNKAVTLVGESVNATIIETRVYIGSPNVTVKGFTIRGDVLVDEQSGATIRDNWFPPCDCEGIIVKCGNDTKIVNNSIVRSSGYQAVCLDIVFSENTIVEGNIIEGGWSGVFQVESHHAYIVNNVIKNVNVDIWDIDEAALMPISCTYNVIHHNSFVNNRRNVLDYSWENSGLSSSSYTWDDGYPSGGNYWSDYTGVDAFSGPYQNETGSDGIGDMPYVIHGSIQDGYPLMALVRQFDTGTWNGQSCKVDIASNSTLTDLQFDGAAKTIVFNVTGEEGVGFCRLTIPNVIAQEAWQGELTVLVGGQPVEFRAWQDEAGTYVCFTYSHSEHEIAVVPEMLWSVLPLLMLATFLVTQLSRKKRPLL